MNKTLITTTICATILTGCGSDNTISQPPIEPPKPEPTALPLMVDIVPQAKFEGDIIVRLGAFDDSFKEWTKDANPFLPLNKDKDLNGDQIVNERDFELAGGYVTQPDPIIVDAQAMDELLRTNPDGLGAGSARPDIFVKGNYSAFDLLRYIALTEDSLRIDEVIPYDQTGLDTYGVTVSWDANGDGEFTAEDGAQNFQSKHWHFRFNLDGGDNRITRSTNSGIGPAGEGNYMRMDQLWLKPDMMVRFEGFPEEMTNRRQWVLQREQERYAAAGNKVIIPEFQVSVDGGRPLPTDPATIINLEVTAHNLRPDVFQPGVITAMDVFLSAYDAGHHIAVNYWPTVASNAYVGHFALHTFGEVESTVGAGWTTYFGEKDTTYDFFPYSACNFNKDGTPGTNDQVDADTCYDHWSAYFGGPLLHLMTDVWVMNRPVEYAQIKYVSHFDAFGFEDTHSSEIVDYDFSANKDGSDVATLSLLSLPTEDSPAPLLDEQHFGWKIADCAMCHNNSEPLGHGGHSWPINTVDGFSEIQPYFCASCHGANGGPSGHGETTRCYWCHNSDELPKNHGEASAKRIVSEPNQIQGNLKWMFAPADGDGNHSPYADVVSGYNSEYSRSKTFPDPYSCMTCHPNEK